MKKLFVGLLAVMMVMFTMGVSDAATFQTITPGSGWHSFGWPDYEVGDAVDTAVPVVASWDTIFLFILHTPTKLTVTDAFLTGDQFEVWLGFFEPFGGTFVDHAVVLGQTSTPTSGPEWTSDFDEAAASPIWSSGSWVLGPGIYYLSGDVIQDPWGSGAGAVKLSAVPVPGALLLLGSGLVGLLGLRRKFEA